MCTRAELMKKHSIRSKKGFYITSTQQVHRIGMGSIGAPLRLKGSSNKQSEWKAGNEYDVVQQQRRIFQGHALFQQRGRLWWR